MLHEFEVSGHDVPFRVQATSTHQYFYPGVCNERAILSTNPTIPPDTYDRLHYNFYPFIYLPPIFSFLNVLLGDDDDDDHDDDNDILCFCDEAKDEWKFLAITNEFQIRNDDSEV